MPFRPLIALLFLALALSPLAACSSDCCTVDSFPIALGRAPLGPLATTSPGAVLVNASDDADGAPPFKMLFDTGTPITVLGGDASGTLTIGPRSFRLLDAASGAATRGFFRGINSLQLPLHPAGTTDTAIGGVMGADILGGYAIDIRLAAVCGTLTTGATAPMPAPSLMCPQVTFWNHQGADSGFLADAGYAVIGFSPYGGGEVSAQSMGDFLGLTGPISVGPSRIVVRTCAAPRAFSPSEMLETCCSAAEAVQRASGTDLALLVATGVGPLVLGQSAWTRLTGTLDPTVTVPPLTSAPLLIATWPTPIAAQWTSLPRIALVNEETTADQDPGACVELARSRRIEWVATRQAANPTLAECVQPCDVDPRETDKAQNSAAYLEVGNNVPVAVIDDAEPWLQGLRFDVRPEGPDIDGVLGAGALGPAHLEIDYHSSPPRLILSCDGASRDSCWAAGRCPRLPDNSQKHVCFGLPLHGLPQTCVPSQCPVQ
ncbi:MAG TPA: hypothetical protein VGL59_08680 [Polyangia bacterium]